jgi:Uroporphyrinogen-III synthase HemD
MPHTLNGLRVVSFESRRAAEMAELIRNYGGEPIQAPSMREVPLTDQREALAFGKTLLAGDWDALILLTGVGTRMLIAACATRWPKDEVVKALGRLTSAAGQTDRRAQGGWPRAGARGARAEYLARPAFGAGPQAPGRGKARRRSGVRRAQRRAAGRASAARSPRHGGLWVRRQKRRLYVPK